MVAILLNAADFRMLTGNAVQLSPTYAKVEALLKAYPTLTQDEERLMTLELIRFWSRDYFNACARSGAQPGNWGAVLLTTEQGATQLIKNIRAKGNWKKLKEIAKNPNALPEDARADATKIKNAVAAVPGFQQHNMANVFSKPMTTVPGANPAVQVPLKTKSLDAHSWLEVFDPAHRTTYTTWQYYQQWLKWVTPPELGKPNPDYQPDYRESFFDYLDKTADRRTTRATYFNEEARKCFEVVVRGQMLYSPRNPLQGERIFSTKDMRINDGVFNQLMVSRNVIQDVTGVTGRGMWVISPDKRIFSAPSFTLSDRGFMINYHHSSFLSGGAILCGGAWEVVDGEIRVISAASGHYRPPFDNFVAALRIFQQHGLDLSKAAAQWPTRNPDAHEYFKASDLLIPGVRAAFPGWPKLIGSGRALRRVMMRVPGTYWDPENVDPNNPPAYDPLPMAPQPPAAPVQQQPQAFPDGLYRPSGV